MFDLETNGFSGSSVIEGFFLKCVYQGKDLRIADSFHRFYYPREPFNPHAFRVHGIGPETIENRRLESPSDYPPYFDLDRELFAFSLGVDRWVAHNISFDSSFLPFPIKKKYCTMLSSTDILRLPGGRYGNFKYPTLKELAAYYGIHYDPSKAHGAEYDTMLLYGVFKKMAESELPGLLDFLAD